MIWWYVRFCLLGTALMICVDIWIQDTEIWKLYIPLLKNALGSSGFTENFCPMSPASVGNRDVTKKELRSYIGIGSDSLDNYDRWKLPIKPWLAGDIAHRALIDLDYFNWYFTSYLQVYHCL